MTRVIQMPHVITLMAATPVPVNLATLVMERVVQVRIISTYKYTWRIRLHTHMHA